MEFTCINCNEKYKTHIDKCKICGYPVKTNEKLVHVSRPKKQKDDVRQYILNRIAEIKQDENGFSNKARYGEFSIGSVNGTVKADASKIVWEELSDYDLVLLFERLVRRYNAQM